MEKISLLDRLELVESSLDSGVSALNLVQRVLSEEMPLSEPLEALHIVNTYLQNVSRELSQLISAAYKENLRPGDET